MTRKIIGFILFILTGAALIFLSISEASNPVYIGLFAVIAILFAVGLTDHFKDLKK